MDIFLMNIYLDNEIFLKYPNLAKKITRYKEFFFRNIYQENHKTFSIEIQWVYFIHRQKRNCFTWTCICMQTKYV